MSPTLLKPIILFFVVYSSQFLIGTLVENRNLKVNYSRKIVHLIGFLSPILIEIIINSKFEYKFTVQSFVLGLVAYCIVMLFYLEPVRKRSKIMSRLFVAIDRPEDRPHTLLWLFTQVIVGYCVLVPFFALFQNKGYTIIAVIPILINGLGDGFAELVGVKFGKHKYQVPALFTKKKYFRSLEGSACVFIVTFLILVFFRSSFTHVQFIAIISVLPLVSTIAEAFAPHTWDTPLIFFVGYMSLYLVKMI